MKNYAVPQYVHSEYSKLGFNLGAIYLYESPIFGKIKGVISKVRPYIENELVTAEAHMVPIGSAIIEIVNINSVMLDYSFSLRKNKRSLK